MNEQEIVAEWEQKKKDMRANGTDVYLGFSILQSPAARRYEIWANKDGIVNTGCLDAARLPWEWNGGADGPVLAGPGWLPTVSLPGCG